jgi:molybdenum cofactor cytidylyltransferase
MGRAKALLPFRDGTFLSVLAGTLSPFCLSVTAVFGCDGEHVKHAAPAGVMTAINPDYRLGMLTSLQTGLRSLDESAETVLFTPVDHPAVSAGTIALLLNAGAEIAIPRIAGRRGHPVVISREIAREFLREPAASKIRDVIDRHADRIRYIEVDDTAINDDVDDPALYAALLAREAGRA